MMILRSEAGRFTTFYMSRPGGPKAVAHMLFIAAQLDRDTCTMVKHLNRVSQFVENPALARLQTPIVGRPPS